MKTKHPYRQLRDLFDSYEDRLRTQIDENECQLMLLNLAKVAANINDPGLASRFESSWLDLRDKLKELADCRVYNDAKKEIEEHLAAVLEPESVNS